jgi:toxin FitB
LDTNVISELTKARPYTPVVEWLRSVDETVTYLSVITLGEIWRGIQLLPSGKKRNTLSDWFERELVVRFAGRILSIDESISVLWGAVAARAHRMGRPLSVLDAFLAATAERHNLTLVTRNVDDFSAAEVRVLNPWDQ